MSGQPETLAAVRRAVREIVTHTPELQRDSALARRVAEQMVKVSMLAATLMREEREIDDAIRRHAGPSDAERLATAQAAADSHGQSATRGAAGTLRATRDAIDFPGFVTSLITGVFQSISTSSIQQLQAVADLLDAVGMSTSQFATSQIDAGRARQWLTQRFPQFVVSPGEDEGLAIRDGADMPSREELQSALGATREELDSVDESSLEETLIPIVRRKLARDRQSMLATMVLMGLRRVVVDDGRIKASMELQVDARSTAEQTQASQLDTRVSTAGQGSFGVGAWGASASLSATVGYVKSDQQYSREDLAVRAGLRSTVEVGFHTEPFQLGRVASSSSVTRIRDRSMVPETEHKMESLLGGEERRTQAPTFAAPPSPPEPPPLPPKKEKEGPSEEPAEKKTEEPKKTDGEKTEAKKPEPKKTETVGSKKEDAIDPGKGAGK